MVQAEESAATLRVDGGGKRRDRTREANAPGSVLRTHKGPKLSREKSCRSTSPDCTANRHRWVSRECTGEWENNTEGTRQTRPSILIKGCLRGHGRGRGISGGGPKGGGGMGFPGRSPHEPPRRPPRRMPTQSPWGRNLRMSAQGWGAEAPHSPMDLTRRRLSE